MPNNVAINLYNMNGIQLDVVVDTDANDDWTRLRSARVRVAAGNPWAARVKIWVDGAIFHDQVYQPGTDTTVTPNYLLKKIEYGSQVLLETPTRTIEEPAP